MAVKETTTVEFIDDITGEASEDVKMYSFGLDDTWYEIDLSDKSAEKIIDKFRKAVIDVARVSDVQDRSVKPSRRGGSKPTGRPKRSAAELADVRRWAAENGFEVSDKGRIPAKVWEAYDAAPAPAAG